MESDMDSIRPDILLFLRKIKSMEIQSLKGSWRLFSMRERDGIPNVIIRIKEYEGTTSNPPRKSLNHYHVSRRTVKKLPKDDRRPKIASTEIVLAFPLVDGYPDSKTHSVYAFLPLRNFGFKVRTHLLPTRT